MSEGVSTQNAPLNPARLVGRALVIVLLFLVALGRWFFGAVWLRLTFQGPQRRLAWQGHVLLELFRSLGATFVKLGQILSTRTDLLPQPITRALAHLQDDVGPFPYSATVRTITEDFGRPISDLFNSFEATPLASASVAQVHRARLPDGRTVAVKVRRPGVVELCGFDLGVLRALARFAVRFAHFVPLAPVGAVDELGRAIFAQLDFRIEARNNRRFRENFRNDADVVFPEIIESLCSERVLTMTFIEGQKILSPTPTTADPRHVARVGLRTLLKMIFQDGFVHADLHPGNILITPNGQVALLDLGLVGRLDPDARRTFALFFAAWAQRDGESMARLLFTLSSTDGSHPFEPFRLDLIAFVDKTWGRSMGETQIGQVLSDMMGILRRHRLRANATFTVVNIAIAVTEGIAKQLDPTLDLMAEALPYFLAHPVEAA